MPRCIVVGCKSGYDTCNEKVRMFCVPKNIELLAAWQKAINRNDIVISSSHFVCEKHFIPEDIIRQRELLDQKTGRVLGISTYKRPQLRKGSVPSVNCNSHSNSLGKKNVGEITGNFKHSGHDDGSYPAEASNCKTSPPLCEENMDITLGSDDISRNSQPFFNELHQTEQIPSSSIVEIPEPQVSFHSIERNIEIPRGWSAVTSIANEPSLHFIQMISKRFNSELRVISYKRITIDMNLNMYVALLDKPIDPVSFGFSQVISSYVELQSAIQKIDAVKLCPGYFSDVEYESSTSFKDAQSHYRHVNCHYVITDTHRCICCEKIRKTINQKISRLRRKGTPRKVRFHGLIERQQYMRMRNQFHAERKAKCRLQKLVTRLKSELTKTQLEMKKITNSKLDDIVKATKTPKNTHVVLKEIVASSKIGNPKGRRYSDEWLMLSLLFHMKSPKSFNFLKDNGYLPLPCIRTIRRYLSLIDTPCGFDPAFLELFKKFMETKTENQKHGVILVDEMATRESVSVNSTNLTYRGLVDFGDEVVVQKDFNKQANHGLVILFQPINDSYSQPVSVFASHGPVPGVTLAQLILKCIAHLEKAGAYIHGVISDGASTNRKFWEVCGINGKMTTNQEMNCSFNHPLKDDRKIFVFSDTPHLIKCIRNRLSSVDLQMNPEEPLIKWNHIKALQETDKQALAPKLTPHHINLNNTAKMRVSLAVQVFSNSVARSLKFYQNSCSELADCASTITFVQWMNDLFDALNRPQSKGVSVYNPDYKLLQESLEKLDKWERLVNEGLIDKGNFLTKQTAQGLRVSLHSMLELINYLTLKYQFTSVPTGRINQDPIERFFGTIRQTCGANDHPTNPTFLQLYKIHSIFGILKPPKKGNCSVSSHDPEPLFSFSEIKAIFQQSKSQVPLSETIKQKIEQSLSDDNWDFYDVVDNGHDYSSPEIINCIAYCLTSYLEKRISKISCEQCLNAISGQNEDPQLLPSGVSASVISPTFGHPNKQLYNFVLKLEKMFEKHCDSPYVSDLLLNDVVNSDILKFPCVIHKAEMLSRIVTLFLQIRMREFCTKMNQNPVKKNQTVKKSAKFCNT